jgi:hypothetical protein
LKQDDDPMSSKLFQEPEFREKAQTVLARRKSTGPDADGFGTHAVMLADAAHADLADFHRVRRKASRLTLLHGAGRLNATELGRFAEVDVPTARRAFTQMLAHLGETLDHLRPVLVPELEAIVQLHGQDGHPLQAGLEAGAEACGFSEHEVAWLKGECQSVDWRLMTLLMEDDPENLDAILKGASIPADLGVGQFGFLRLTGDPAVDERIQKIVARCRAAGVTASLYHLWPIVLAATMVAASTDAPDVGDESSVEALNRPHLLAHYDLMGFFAAR